MRCRRGGDALGRPLVGGAGLLAASDLHLGKSNRAARRTGTLLPPYESDDTPSRFDADIAALNPATVICLGDSLDDLDSTQALQTAGEQLYAVWPQFALGRHMPVERLPGNP